MNSGEAVSTHEGNKQYLSTEALATYSNTNERIRIKVVLADSYTGHSMSNQQKKNPYPHRFEQKLVPTQCQLRH